MIRKLSIALGLVLAFAAFSSPALADHHEGPAVINVLTFEVGTNAQQFIALTKRANAIQEKLGRQGTQRVWSPTFGSNVAGVVIVTLEYPSLVSMANSQAKSAASPEWQAFVQEVQAADFRLVSSSLATDASGN